MPPILNDAYYNQLTKRMQDSTAQEFSAIVGQHKADVLATKFKEPSEKVFEQNFNWLVEQVILQSGTRSFKNAADITDADLAKLEVFRKEYGFDYMKDIRIGFTDTRENRRLEYKQSFLTYLAAKDGDFTDYQAEVIGQLVARLEADKRMSSLGYAYGMYSGRGNNHNQGKNIFHVLMEGELTPNKKKIADLVAPELAQSIYQVYAHTESWKGSYGQDVTLPFDTWRNALHNAVASGKLENVEYALSKGAKQSTRSGGYGSTAFADAVARNSQPNYRAIALTLFEHALTLEKGAEILREGARWERESSRPIEILARAGDLRFTVAMAQANAGIPEMAVETFTHSSPVTLGGYYGSTSDVYHPPVHTTRTRTEYHVFETGKTEDPFPYIRQAVFNLDPNASYTAYQDVFGLAVKHLVDKGALEAADIPKDSLTDPRSLNFIFTMRAAAEAEKARNPDFLAKTAVFTDGFTEEVKKVKAASKNFSVRL